MKKPTQRQCDEAVEFWQQQVDIFIATTPPEQLFKLKRKCEAGAVIRITPKREGRP